MTELYFILLAILYPRSIPSQAREVARSHLGNLLAWFGNDHLMAQLLTDPAIRREFEGHIIASEDFIHAVIHAKAREILGLPYIHRRTRTFSPPHTARSFEQVFARFERLVALFNDMERLA